MASLIFVDDFSESKTFKKNKAKGIFEVAGFKENFYSNLNYWSKKDYYIQWLYSLYQIKSGNNANLIIDWAPQNERQIRSVGLMFCFYPNVDGSTNIAMRQNYIFSSEYFDKEVNHEIIKTPDRKKYNDDGYLISEWLLKVKDIDDLAKSIYKFIPDKKIR